MMKYKKEQKKSTDGWNIDARTLIEACRKEGKRIRAYVRVSSEGQDYFRQIQAMVAAGVHRTEIYEEKQSGKDFERKMFQKMLCDLQAGDLVVFKELDRMGRNMKEMNRLIVEMTCEKSVQIAFLDDPLLNRTQEQSSTGFLLSNLMCLVQSYIAEQERCAILKRTAEGRKIAMEKGIVFGRPEYAVPEAFREIQDDILSRTISYSAAKSRLGVNYRTLKKWIRIARREKLLDILTCRKQALEHILESFPIHDAGTGESFPVGDAGTEESFPTCDARTGEAFRSLKDQMRVILASLSGLSETIRKGSVRAPEFDENGLLLERKIQGKESELDAKVTEWEMQATELVHRADKLIRIAEEKGLVPTKTDEADPCAKAKGLALTKPDDADPNAGSAEDKKEGQRNTPSDRNL